MLSATIAIRLVTLLVIAVQGMFKMHLFLNILIVDVHLVADLEVEEMIADVIEEAIEEDIPLALAQTQEEEVTATVIADATQDPDPTLATTDAEITAALILATLREGAALLLRREASPRRSRLMGEAMKTKSERLL